jgi:hypothetical protein
MGRILRVVVAAIMTVAGAAPSASGAAVSAPVRVSTGRVTLAAHDQVRVPVACHRQKRSCRGELVLGQQQLCSGVPVGDPSCQVVLGRGRFAIAAGKRQAVAVRRVAGAQAVSQRSDSVDVIATPYLERGRGYPVTERSRRVRLLAPLVISRPAVVPEVTTLYRLTQKEQGARALAHLPLTTTGSRVEVVGVEVPLHRDRFLPFVTHPRSFVVAGTRWHGEVPITSDEPRAGSVTAARLVACAGDVCSSFGNSLRVSSDPAEGPICRLSPPRRLA